jgi:hypothetical protein
MKGINTADIYTAYLCMCMFCLSLCVRSSRTFCVSAGEVIPKATENSAMTAEDRNYLLQDDCTVEHSQT